MSRINSLPSGAVFLAFTVMAAAFLQSAAPSRAQLIEVESPLDQSAGKFGWSVAGIDDLTGDGHGDFIVGAIDDKVAGISAGRVYLFDGATRQVVRALDSPAPFVDSGFGFAVAAVPDVNGDGLPDVIVGGEQEGADPAAQGGATLFSGADGAFLRNFVSPNPAGAGFFGTAVAGIADLNGDSRGEIVIGASGEGPQNTGRAYVFSGANGALLRTLNDPAPAGSMGRFGGAVAAVPDANGDEAPDILVGAQDELVASTFGVGRAYLFSGANGTLVRTLSSSNPQSGGAFGVAVAGLPDVTGDGRGDLIIGARGENSGGGANGGRAYVFNGATGGLIRTFVAPNNFEQFGYSVAGIPNFTGDGTVTYLIGAQTRSYLFASSNGALLQTINNPALPLGGMESFGQSVSAIPDIDGDGRGDAVLGAPLNGIDGDGDQTQAGRAYVLLSGGPPLATPTPSTSPTVSRTPSPSRTPSLTASPTVSPTPTIPPPYFILHPASQAANTGQDVAFYAEAIGVPTLAYSWLRFDLPFGPDAPSLLLTNVHSTAAGQYACKVQNPGGMAQSQTATLTVFGTKQPNGASFASSTLPAVLAPNQELFIGITMTNTSALTWSTAQGYSLGVKEDAGGLFNGATRFALAAPQVVVASGGGAYQFVAAIRAPAAPGAYVARVQMVEEFVEFFGQVAELDYQVAAPPNAAESWTRYD